MADEVVSASAEVENNSESIPEDTDPKKIELSPDISGYSNKSRYGRARKPKITEDFYNIEDIFGPYEKINSSSPRRKSHRLELSPNIDEDVSKVMKIVSNNDFSPKTSTYPSKSIKTYANKHKKILESHEYKINGSKISETNHKSEIFKSVLFPQESSDSFDAKPVLHRAKSKSVTEDIKRDFDTTEEDFSEDFAKLAKNNKKINKLQRDLNIVEFKTGRLRSSIADRSFTEDELEPEVEPEPKVEPEPEPEPELAKIKEEIQEFELNDEVPNAYSPNVGELAWSRVGTYPFWPSIVTNEPGFDRHSRVVMFGRKYVKCYHVNFFGDNGRRSWVLATHIYPFNRRSDLEIMAQNVSKDSKPKDPKHLSAFIINPNKLKKWETAVTEAESITEISPKSRIEKFFEMVSPKKKAIKRPLSSPKLGKVAHKKIKLDKKTLKKLKKSKKNKSDEENILKSPSPSNKSETEDKPVKNKIKNPKNKLEPDKPTDKKKLKQSEEPKSDESSSESDLLLIKEEIRDTPSPVSLIQRQKKINLFRGITKERVCQICGKNKQVYKCKGNCFGLYHIECDKKIRLKVLSKLSEEKLSNSDYSDEEKTKKSKNNRRSDVASILDTIFDKVFDVIDGKCSDIKIEECDIKIEDTNEEMSKIDHNIKPDTTEERFTKIDNSSKKSSKLEVKTTKSVDKTGNRVDKIEEIDNLSKTGSKLEDKLENTTKSEERSTKIDNSSKKSTKLEVKTIKSSDKTGNRVDKIEEIDNLSKTGSKLEDKLENTTKSEERSTKIDNSSKKSSKLEVKTTKSVDKQEDTADKTANGGDKTEENSSKTDNSSKKSSKLEVNTNKTDKNDNSSKSESKLEDKLAKLDKKAESCVDSQQNPSKPTEPGQKEETKIEENKLATTVEILSSPTCSKTTSKKRSLSLAEQIDLKMAEVMQNLITETKYTDSTTDEEDLTDSITIDPFKKELEEYSHLPAIEDDKKVKKIIKHVTADGIFDIIEEENPNNEDFKCAYCSTGIQQPCFICNKDEDPRHRCFTAQCGKYYHSECLKDWPQTKWNVSSKSKKIENETLSCPYHNCHTCISDNPRGPLSRYTNERLAKCIRCPTTYHSNNFCVPAGTYILSQYQLICPKHLTPAEDEDLSSSPRSVDSKSKEKKTKLKMKRYSRDPTLPPTEDDDLPSSPRSTDSKTKDTKKSSKLKIMPHMNASWCFICSMGGSLICCETCPSAFHVECLKLVPPEGRYLCEECESGRLPLYDEIVWVKLGAYRWWPAQILYPADVPPNVAAIPHTIGEFVVRFFGSHDHYWVNRGRVFLFQEGDTGHASSKKSAVDGLFVKAIEEATKAHKKFIDERANRALEAQNGMRPPAYIKIKVNRPVGNVRNSDADTSNTTPCDCDPTWDQPCGPDSDCLNRILMTECNPMVCAAGSRCCNQSFEKRLYAPIAPFRTTGRGWGLKTLAPVKKGAFVIEYVGEVIDEVEYRRRMRRKHEQKDENYYFLTIDKDRMIDAGPKGNVARFMNHSCSPNCETQKWTINGDTRVGLFAITDIPADAELTFNYNLECIGEEKKECRCGAPNCSGFIGDKAKQDEAPKKRKSVPLKSKKKKSLVPEVKLTEIITCFVCGGPDAIQSCDRESCNKFYHLQCVSLENYQEGKWLCPWHSCSICSKRTSRCCYMCINSYCPLHSEGYIRYKRNIGFVCTTHDIKEEDDTDLNSEDSKTKDLSKAKKTKKSIRSSTDSNKNIEEVIEPKEEPKSSSETSSRRSSKSDEPELKDTKEDKPKKPGKISKIPEETLTSKSSTDQITIQNGAVMSEISRPKSEEIKTDISSSEEIIQIDIVASTKTPINSSIKKRKSRLSLKQNTESSSSQDSDDEKPLVTLKKIKLSEETSPKMLRSTRSLSQEDLTATKLTKTANLSLDLDTSSSESDFIVKKIVKKKTKVKKSAEPKKLRSSMNTSVNNEEKTKTVPKMKKMLTSTPKSKSKLNATNSSIDLQVGKTEDLNVSQEDLKSNKPKKRIITAGKPEMDLQASKKEDLSVSQEDLKSIKPKKKINTAGKPETDLQVSKKDDLNVSHEDLKSNKPKKRVNPAGKPETDLQEDLNASSNPKKTPKRFNLSLKKPENRRLTRNAKQTQSEDELSYSSIDDTDEETKTTLKEPAKKKNSLRKSLRDTPDNQKEETNDNGSLKRKRGRPRKYPKEDKIDETIDIPETPETKETITETTPNTKRPKGRPRKHPIPIEPTKTDPPKNEPPKSEPPKSDPPKSDPPKSEPPKSEPRKSEPPKSEPEGFKTLMSKPFDNPVKEVKLTANVPERHLRVVLRKNEIDQKIDNKFLKMQNDIERDLPIRKRSKLRYEAQL